MHWDDLDTFVMLSLAFRARLRLIDMVTIIFLSKHRMLEISCMEDVTGIGMAGHIGLYFVL